MLPRLAFHHFPDIKQPVAEMVRVLKPGSRLALIDMEAAKETLREPETKSSECAIPSHVRNLSRTEMFVSRERIDSFVLRDRSHTDGFATLAESCQNAIGYTSTYH